MKKLSKTLMAGSFGLALLVLSGVGTASYLNIKQLNENRQWVDHTYEVLSTLDRIIDGVKDSERGRRGYIIARKETYLKTYEAGVANTQESLTKLRILTVDNPPQQRRQDELEIVIAQRLNILKKSIALWDKNQSDLNTQIALTDEGVKLLTEIEAKIALMNTEEQSLLKIRSDLTNASVSNTTIAMGLGYALSFAILVTIYFFLDKQIRISQGIQARLEQRSQMLDLANEELEIRVEQRTKVLKTNEDLYRTLTNNFPRGLVFLFDQDLRYFLAAGTELALIGVSREGLEGKTLWESFSAETCEGVEPLYRAALAGETQNVEFAYQGKIYSLYTCPVLNEQGEILAGMLIAQDITLEKRAEEILINARDILEIEVKRQTQELTDTNLTLQSEIAERLAVERQLRQLTTNLQRSNQELEQFAYVASHDLQEPLRAVTSYTQLLAKRYQGNLDDRADKYIGYIVDGATRMQQLIQDLLTYSRVGRYELKLEATDCNGIVEQVLRNLQVAIAENAGRVICGDLPTINADSSQIGQLFQNIIGNAIKYHGVESPEVHISATRQEHKWLFAFRDNGIGIDPQYFDRIFVLFQRLHTRQEYAGTGIGLALCKKIIERHHGEIWVESELGKGTTFYLTLPI